MKIVILIYRRVDKARGDKSGDNARGDKARGENIYLNKNFYSETVYIL
jgi:hypothetical protein